MPNLTDDCFSNRLDTTFWFSFDNATYPIKQPCGEVPENVLRVSKNISLQTTVLPKISPLLPQNNHKESYCPIQDFLDLCVYSLLRADAFPVSIRPTGSMWPRPASSGVVDLKTL